MKEWVKKQLAFPNQSIKEVIKVLSNAKIGVAVIVDKSDHLIGFVTDSDIRRAILRDISLDSPVSEIMAKTPVTIIEGTAIDEMIRFMRQKRVNRAPIVDKGNVVKDIALYWKLQESVQNPTAEPNDFTITPEIKNDKGKKVLVIGAGGYVGSVLCRELLKEGYQVRGLDRFLFGEEPIKEIFDNSRFELMRGDICNLGVITDATFGVDAVVNLAAIVGDPACDVDINHSIMVNYFSAKTAADAARHFKVDRYLFASTCAVYGASENDEKLTETSPVAPVSLYAETKLKTEQGILSLADDNFSPCVFRLATVYGMSPRMRFDLVVNLFMQHALTNKKLTVFGGEQWRPYVHVVDVARAFIAGLKAEKKNIHKEIFNLGATSENYRVIDLARKVAEGVPETQIDHKTDAKDQRNYYVSFEKIKNKIGFVNSRNIDFAIKEIKEAFDRGEFQDFKDKKYSNVMQQEHLIFG